MAVIYIGLGANLPSAAGSPAATLAAAVKRLASLGRITVRSSLYSTLPVGFPDQPRFLNAVVEIETHLGPRELLVALLEMALERLGPEAAECMSHDVGVEYGRNLAATVGSGEPALSLKAAIQSIAGILTAHGFAARAEEHDLALSVVLDNCPFGTAAQHHPVLCAVDRGLISGMLDGLGAERRNVTLTSRARGDDDCRVTA